MKLLLVSLLIAFLAFCPPVNAQYLDNYLAPDGGWLVKPESDLVVSAFKSAHRYSIQLEKGIGKDSRIVDTVNIPIDSSDFMARGRFVCYRTEKGFPDFPVVVLLKGETLHKAWIAKENRLKEISVKKITCELDRE